MVVDHCAAPGFERNTRKITSTKLQRTDFIRHKYPHRSLQAGPTCGMIVAIPTSQLPACVSLMYGLKAQMPHSTGPQDTLKHSAPLGRLLVKECVYKAEVSSHRPLTIFAVSFTSLRPPEYLLS